MRKLGFLTAALWAITLLLYPQTGTAKLMEMSDQELHEVTGQAGIALRAEDVIQFNIQGDNFTWANPDSIGPDGNPATFGLYDTVLRGSMDMHDARMDLEFLSEQTASGHAVNGFSLTAHDLTVSIDEFSTDIRLGDKSLGVFGIYGMKAHFSGNVRVYTRAQ
jgi:hypothetical protein